MNTPARIVAPVLFAALYSATWLMAVESVAAAEQAKDDQSRYVTLRESDIVLTNVRVIDGTGGPPRERQSLVISNGRIQQIGERASVKVPDQARVVDLSGRTVLPGLVMLHEHLHYGGPGPSQTFSAPRLYLAFGVTTIRTAGTFYPFHELNLKRAIDAGHVPGPNMFVTSPYIGSELMPSEATGFVFGDYLVRTPEDARRGVRFWAAEGVTSIKVVQTITKEAVAAVIDEAHRLGLPVTAHLESITCREAAELGIDNLEHGLGPCTRHGEVEADPNGPRARALIQRLVELGVVLTVTPNSRPSRPLTARERDVLHPAAYESYVARVQSDQRPAAAPGRLQPLIVPFVKAGGRIVLGSDPYGDGIIPGFANHIVVENLVRGGFNPLEVIRIATLEGAKFLKIDNRVGTVGVGKQADLLVVRGDPSVSIEDIENVEIVFKGGIGYDPAALLAAAKGTVGWR